VSGLVGGIGGSERWLMSARSSGVSVGADDAWVALSFVGTVAGALWDKSV